MEDEAVFMAVGPLDLSEGKTVAHPQVQVLTLAMELVQVRFRLAPRRRCESAMWIRNTST